MSTIFERHELRVNETKYRHRQEMDELDELLRSEQATCKHPSWTKSDSLFYAFGETWPGKKCDECGENVT